MDIFIEHIVKHKTDGKDIAIQIGACFLAVILTMVVVLILAGIPALSFLTALLVFGVWYGAYWLIKSRYVEYEYILTNSSLDIDKIMARTRRKRVISLDLKEIELFASTDDEMHKYEYENKEAISKVLDCTGDGKEGVYFIDFSADGGKKRILFQPTEKMLENSQKYNPRKIFIKR